MSRKYQSDSGGANEALQDTLQRNEARILASYASIGAILLLGGIGYGVDWWAGTLSSVSIISSAVLDADLTRGDQQPWQGQRVSLR